MIRWIEEENARLGLKPEYKGSKPRESYMRDTNGMKKAGDDNAFSQAHEEGAIAAKPAPAQPAFVPDPTDEFDYCVSYAWGTELRPARRGRSTSTISALKQRNVASACAVTRAKWDWETAITRFMPKPDEFTSPADFLFFSARKYLQSPFCTYDWRKSGANAAAMKTSLQNASASS